MINADKLLRLCVNACSTSVNAKTHLSPLLCGIAAGNEVIILSIISPPCITFTVDPSSSIVYHKWRPKCEGKLKFHNDGSIANVQCVCIHCQWCQLKWNDWSQAIYLCFLFSQEQQKEKICNLTCFEFSSVLRLAAWPVQTAVMIKMKLFSPIQYAGTISERNCGNQCWEMGCEDTENYLNQKTRVHLLCPIRDNEMCHYHGHGESRNAGSKAPILTFNFLVVSWKKPPFMTGKTASRMKTHPVAFDLWGRFIHTYIYISGCPPTPDRLSRPLHFGWCNRSLLLSSLYPSIQFTSILFI